MPYRLGTFREQFTRKELGKLGFFKHKGYWFIKKDKDHPGFGWVLRKDDTSARIRDLMYTDGIDNTQKYIGKLEDIKIMPDLEVAIEKCRNDYNESLEKKLGVPISNWDVLEGWGVSTNSDE